MAFRISRGPKEQGGRSEQKRWNEDELIWGVPRRAGHDDLDDPKAHAGLTQHAFEPGNDERAICGFEPTKRATGPAAKPRPQLATPSPRLNPRCPKCSRLIAVQPVPATPPVHAAIQASLPQPPPPAPVAPPPLPPPPVQWTPAPGPTTPPPSTPPPPVGSSPPPPPPSRGESWEGTASFGVGQLMAMVRPPGQPGLGVVASVVSGPSGTRVKSVHIDADGLAVITLSESASAPVTVAWFAVPAVDDDHSPEVPDGSAF